MRFEFEAIGVVRSPLHERASAARQASVGPEIRGWIELFPGRGYEDALDGLYGWGHLWVIFVFHRNLEEGRGWRPKVRPPRSAIKRGVFATRSPHRPNPIGMSAVEIERVEGLAVHVRSLDILDGSPVLDLKPYVPYADAISQTRSGWLEGADPAASWQVVFAEPARIQLAWLGARGIGLQRPIEAALAPGPQPHAYRRIRKNGEHMTLALKEWRVDFVTREDRTIVVARLRSGYRAKELATDAAPEVHRAFADAFSP